MNIGYLNEEKIQTITEITERYLTPSNKKKLKQLSAKYGVEFGGDGQKNRDLLWVYVRDLLGQDDVSRISTGETFKQATLKSTQNGYA